MTYFDRVKYLNHARMPQGAQLPNGIPGKREARFVGYSIKRKDTAVRAIVLSFVQWSTSHKGTAALVNRKGNFMLTRFVPLNRDQMELSTSTLSPNE